MTHLDQPAKDDLEQLIDRNGLDAVLDALRDICAEKAEHVLTNWQDKQAAKDWDQAAGVLDRASAKISILI
jgi:hypothetical protein